MRTAIAAIATLVTMGILDAIWLSTMTSRLYRKELPELIRDSPSPAPALAFYLLYAAGVLVFVVLPALDRGWAVLTVLGTGALLGLVAYGTYDLTNQATLRGWSPLVTVVDLMWGATLTAVVASVAVAAARRLT